MGAEGPLCRQGEVWKNPEGLDGRCHLTAKQQQLAHYRRWNLVAWQRSVEDISLCTTCASRSSKNICTCKPIYEWHHASLTNKSSVLTRGARSNLLYSYRAWKGMGWLRPVQNASRIWNLARQLELLQCEEMELLAARQETASSFCTSASYIFCAGIHFFQQVFTEKKNFVSFDQKLTQIQGLHKTRNPPPFSINGQTEEHCCWCPFPHEIAIPTIRHATNLCLHCPKAHCTLPALLLFSLHFPSKVFLLGFCSQKLSTLSGWTNCARSTHSIADLPFLCKPASPQETPLQVSQTPWRWVDNVFWRGCRQEIIGEPMGWEEHNEQFWVERVLQREVTDTENYCCQAGWLKFRFCCWCPESSWEGSPGMGKPFSDTWHSVVVPGIAAFQTPAKGNLPATKSLWGSSFWY